MVGAEDGGHLIDGLTLGAVLLCVHAYCGGSNDPAALRGCDGDGREGSALVVAGGSEKLVSNGFVGPALAREHHMLGFDGLARTSRRRDSDELAEELPAEHAVILQPLIAALELGYFLVGALCSGAPDGTGWRSRHVSRSDQRSGTQ
jgi:hypothetical protein